MFQMLFLDSKSQQTNHYVTYVKDIGMLYCGPTLWHTNQYVLWVVVVIMLLLHSCAKISGLFSLIWFVLYWCFSCTPLAFPCSFTVPFLLDYTHYHHLFIIVPLLMKAMLPFLIILIFLMLHHSEQQFQISTNFLSSWFPCYCSLMFHLIGVEHYHLFHIWFRNSLL